jgi:hypothetical protein
MNRIGSLTERGKEEKMVDRRLGIVMRSIGRRG